MHRLYFLILISELVIIVSQFVLRAEKEVPWVDPFYIPSYCYTFISSILPSISLLSSSLSFYINVGSDNHVTSFARTSTLGFRGLEGSTALGRQLEALSTIIPTIHGTFFLWLQYYYILWAPCYRNFPLWKL
jgi:hypothetical protein